MKNERNKLNTIKSNYMELIELRKYYHANEDHEGLKEINSSIKAYEEIMTILNIEYK